MNSGRAVASMAGATIVSRILGFVRVIVVAAVLGTTALGNTFQSTNSISNVLFDLLAAGALSAALVPQLVRALQRSNKEMTDMVRSLMTIVLIVLGTITILGEVFASQLAHVIFARAPLVTRDQQIHTGTILLRFFIPQVLLYGIGAIAIAALTAKKKFVTTVLAPIGSSLVLIIFLGFFYMSEHSSDLILSTRSTFLLGLAGTGACLAFIVIPLIVAIRCGVGFLPSTNVGNGLSVLSSSIWAIAIQASAAIILATTIFIGNNKDGAVVAYQLAFVFFLAPYAIFSQSFATVLLPDLSQSATSDKTDRTFSNLVRTMMTWTYRPMTVIAAICIALGEPLMRIVSEGRANHGFEMVEICFVTLILGLLPYSVFQATSRIYFAKGNIRLPAVTIICSSIVVGAFSVYISQYVHGNSLVLVMGLSHTSMYLIAALFLVVSLKREGLDVLPNLITWIVIAGSAVYAIVGIYVEQIVDVQGRLHSISYSVLYLVVTLAIIYVATPPKYRRKLRGMISKVKHSSDADLAASELATEVS